MCTILLLRTNSKFRGNKINREEFKKWLLYRGRDVYKTVVYTPNESEVKEHKTADDVISYLSKFNSKCLIAVFGRAIPEVESDDGIKQPMLIKNNDGKKLLCLHHGIYDGKKVNEEYDSLELAYHVVNKDDKRSLRKYSSFTFIVAEPEYNCRYVTAYVGQLPFAIVETDEFVAIGTIPNIANHHYAYSIVSLNFYGDNYSVKVDPLSYDDNEVGYITDLVNYDVLSFVKCKYANVLSLFSGGMDSLISTCYFLEKCKQHGVHVLRLYLLFFNYGQRALKAERLATHNCAKYLSRKYDISVDVIEHEIDLMPSNITSLTERDSARYESRSDSNYVPMRNLILISNAAAICESLNCSYLLVGFNLSEGMTYNDNSSTFYYNLCGALEIAGKRGYRLNLVAPLLNMTKTECVEWAIANKIDLSKSISCYYPDENNTPCNKCGSCILRQQAIERAKKRLKDTTTK